MVVISGRAGRPPGIGVRRALSPSCCGARFSGDFSGKGVSENQELAELVPIKSVDDDGTVQKPTINVPTVGLSNASQAQPII